MALHLTPATFPRRPPSCSFPSAVKKRPFASIRVHWRFHPLIPAHPTARQPGQPEFYDPTFEYLRNIGLAII